MALLNVQFDECTRMRVSGSIGPDHDATPRVGRPRPRCSLKPNDSTIGGSMNELRNELRDDVIAAHGGLDRWNELTSVKAHLVNDGVLWAMKGQAGVIDDVNVRVDLHREFTSHFPFGRPGLRSAFTADRVAIEGDAGEVVEERFNPRDSFAGHTLETPWDKLHLAYFAGYAMWTYLTSPFSFVTPGFQTEELSRWQEHGQTWRRLKVTFPGHIASHCKEQTFYFNADGSLDCTTT